MGRYGGLMDRALLEDALVAEPAFRARQVWEWAARGAAGYDEMTNVPTPLRARLAETVPFSTLTLEHEAHSSDGTLKALFRTHDGHPGRGGADALPRRPPLGLRLVAVRLPVDLHVLRDRTDALRPQSDVLGDPRPGSPLSPPRAAHAPRLHGHGRADVQRRLGRRRRRVACPTSASRTGARRCRRSVGCPACAASSTKSGSRSASRSHCTRRTTRSEAS